MPNNPTCSATVSQPQKTPKHRRSEANALTAEQRIRGLCMVLLAAQDDEALLRLLPRFREAVRELEAELNARPNGHQQEKRCA